MRGNGGIHCGRFHRLRQPCLHQIHQSTYIYRHQYIGWRAAAFGFHTLKQSVLEENGVDLHAALRGKRIQQRLYQAGLAGGVQRNFCGGGRCRQHPQVGADSQNLRKAGQHAALVG